ncbi:hypothetical protein Ahia01_001421900, partial [Argonauta hians]
THTHTCMFWVMNSLQSGNFSHPHVASNFSHFTQLSLATFLILMLLATFLILTLLATFLTSLSCHWQPFCHPVALHNVEVLIQGLPHPHPPPPPPVFPSLTSRGMLSPGRDSVSQRRTPPACPEFFVTDLAPPPPLKVGATKASPPPLLLSIQTHCVCVILSMCIYIYVYIH